MAATFAWQGWTLELPSRWNPVKLEGDYAAGYALIADMNRPRLGVRWKAIKAKRFDAGLWAERAMRDEVGRLSATHSKPSALPDEKWKSSLLFLDPEPPGRDVWVAQSRASGRVIEIVYHSHRRDRILQESILPGLSDTEAGQSMRWSIFDLACSVPTEFELTNHRLNAGDLTLHFRPKGRMLTVRQIALAGMALRKQPLEKWLANQERTTVKHFAGSAEPQAAEVGSLSGLSRLSDRRTRFALARWIPKSIVTYVLHDETRDRLLFIQSSDDAIAREVAQSMVSP